MILKSVFEAVAMLPSVIKPNESKAGNSFQNQLGAKVSYLRTTHFRVFDQVIPRFLINSGDQGFAVSVSASLLSSRAEGSDERIAFLPKERRFS